MKILCIRLRAIGDVVVTTPVYRALARQLGAEVHVLVQAVPAQVLRHNPHISRLVLHGTPEAEVARLRAERYDLVVDLHCNLRSHRLRLALGRPTLGYRKRNFEKWLLTRGIDLLGREHLVDRYFRALEPLGVVDDGGGLDYYPQPGELASARAELSSGGDPEPTGDFVALVLAATRYTKRPTPELAAGIIAGVTEPVVLFGGDDVRELAAAVLALLTPAQRARTLDSCGRLTLRESCALLGAARVVVTPDTGLMHVAAALGRPIVTLWGNTAPGFGMYPFNARAQPTQVRDALVEGLGCHPCSRIGYDACPRGHFRCMREQDVAAITASSVGTESTAAGEPGRRLAPPPPPPPASAP